MPARKEVERMRDCSDTLGWRVWIALGSFGLGSSSGVTISGLVVEGASSSFVFAPGLGFGWSDFTASPFFGFLSARAWYHDQPGRRGRLGTNLLLGGGKPLGL
jgi:hypothetical protein